MALNRLVEVTRSVQMNERNNAGECTWLCHMACGHEPVHRYGQVPPKRLRCVQCGPKS